MATSTADMGYATINIIYARLVFIAFALITLILSFIVFSKSVTLRMTATGKLMHFLFVVESINLVADVFLEAEATRTFLQSTGEFLNTSEVLCRLIYLLDFTSWLSLVWMTVAVVAERTLSRTTSLLSHRLFTIRPRIAQIIIAVVVLISIAFGSFPLWSIQPEIQIDSCRYNVFANTMFSTWSQAVLQTGSYTLPIIIITILTVWLVVVEVLINKRRRQTREFNDDSVEEFVQLQLSYVTLVVAVSYVLLMLPVLITYIVQVTNYKPEDWTLLLAIIVLQLLFVVSIAIRFILFCVVSLLFRRELKAVIRCKPTDISNGQYIELDNTTI